MVTGRFNEWDYTSITPAPTGVRTWLCAIKHHYHLIKSYDQKVGPSFFCATGGANSTWQIRRCCRCGAVVEVRVL